MIMGNKQVVIGICDYRITEIFVYFFDLFGSFSSVRKGRVTVEICFIKVAVFL